VAKILIVDDEADMRTVLFHALRSGGHTVTEAADGEEALRKIKRTKFDLVLLDIMMPRMSGYEVLEKIKKMPSRVDTRVVIVTAKHDPEGIQTEVALGATDHIAKPFLPSELLDVIKRALKGPKRAVEERRGELRRSAEVYGALGELRRDLDD
jgi:twitching motility two-component system response regulator PilH